MSLRQIDGDQADDSLSVSNYIEIKQNQITIHIVSLYGCDLVRNVGHTYKNKTRLINPRQSVLGGAGSVLEFDDLTWLIISLLPSSSLQQSSFVLTESSA